MKVLDKNSFKEVFKEYYNPLCNFAFSYVNDPKMAQDIVQDVFTRVWDKRSDISFRSNAKSYLFQAVKNRSLELLQRQKLDQKVVDSIAYTTDTTENLIEDAASKFMMKEYLYASIRQLPPKCQEIFVLNKLNGLTYNEIAEELEISVKTVENQVGRAYRQLREMMSVAMPEFK